MRGDLRAARLHRDGVLRPASVGRGRASATVRSRSAEVDAKWRDLNSAEQLRVQEALYSGRREALDAIVAEALFTKAARSRGLSLEQYLTREIPQRIRPLTDADIQSFYAENRER